MRAAGDFFEVFCSFYVIFFKFSLSFQTICYMQLPSGQIPYVKIVIPESVCKKSTAIHLRNPPLTGTPLTRTPTAGHPPDVSCVRGVNPPDKDTMV